MLDKLNLNHYQVSPISGFLPSEPLLPRLPTYYDEWETICAKLHQLVAERQIKNAILSLPLLSTENLKAYEEWRRAYVILGFIANAYLWGQEEPPNKLPACVAVPFLQVSRHVSMPPVANYAAENLWNFRLKNPQLSAEDPDNIAILSSFTNSADEEWFFALPAAIEARGGPIVPAALEAFKMASIGNSEGVIHYLEEITMHIKALATILPRMYEKCNPDYFYNTVRTYLAGTTSTELPDGVLYEDEDGTGSHQKYKGPTAAQSSLFHFIDIALGVEHYPTGMTAEAAAESKVKRETFLQEMRNYMPEGHRRFLVDVAQTANIRQYVSQSQNNLTLSEAYNNCLAELAIYRNKHIQIVSRYVVIPSRAAAKRTLPQTEPGTAGRIPIDDGSQAVKESVTLGTGGTAPVEFLKQIRDETKASTI